jgi:LmbE family N-acetylglucosaminyl deacetylase
MQFQDVLIVSPHPDDETIGCGGLISRTIREGGNVTVVCVTCPTDERHKELEAALAVLGGAQLEILTKFPTRWLDDRPLVDLVRPLEKIIDFLTPDLILFPNPQHFHQEHRAAAHATLAATRPSGATGRWRPPICAIYEEIGDYWSCSPTNWQPNVFVALGHEDIDNKCRAMACHKSQDRPVPSERSTEALQSLARLRGAQAGFDFAEAYATVLWRY